jgi:hypothetical protein
VKQKGGSVVEALIEGTPIVSTASGRRPVGTRSLGARVSSALLAAWGGLTGLAPHVLHHVGPLAGAAFLAGAGGQLLFAGIALAVSIPFLLRIHRRFRTWVAPAIALAVMAGVFSLSTFVIGPAISGDDGRTTKQPRIEQAPHDDHH